MVEEKTKKNNSSNVILLLTCISGIYLSFLSWSFFHERIITIEINRQKFQFPLILQLIQNVFAFIIGNIYLYYKFQQTNNNQSYFNYLKNFFNDFQLIKTILMVSLTQSISTPIGNSSLNHIDFVTYLLGKSCKLIPVLLIHTFFYKKKFPLIKYLIAVIITIGIFLFSYKSNNSKFEEKHGNTYLGLIYLFISLVLDGITNSTQDELFKKNKKMTGIHLMISLNFLSIFLNLIFSIFFTNQLKDSLKFVSFNPILISKDWVGYGFTGSIGQIFIFLTLEKFDSLILITINVTRKMFSMLLSLLIFNHKLNFTKISGIFLVFFGISLEYLLKFKQKKVKVN